MSPDVANNNQSSDSSEQFHGQNALYWKFDLSRLHISLRRFQNGVNLSINTALFAILILNLAVLFGIGQRLAFEPLTWFSEVFLGSTNLTNWFWILMIPNLYLFYRLFKGTKFNRFIKREAKQEKGKRVNVAEYLSPPVVQSLDRAWLLTQSRQQRPLGSLQLMEELLDEADVVMLFARLGVNLGQVQEILSGLTKKILPEKNVPGISDELQKIFFEAYKRAADEGRRGILVTDVVLKIATNNEQVKEILAYELKVDEIAVENVIAWIDFQNYLFGQFRNYRAASIHKPKGPINRSYTAAATPILDRFSTDLTQLARSGNLPLSVARDKEIKQLYNAVQGGTSSVLLIGEQGVGKASIVNALANRMAAEDVPPIFQDKRLVSLSAAHLIAGASETGELQERLLFIANEVKRSGNIILFIENIHNIVGISSVGTENVDLSDVLAVQIEDPRIIVLASTTPKNYTMYLEGGPLDADLVKLKIEEPERNNAIKILEANVGYLEHRHRVFFTHGALAAAVDLSGRYMPDQFLPAKAVMLAEEVAASVASSKEAGQAKKYKPVIAEDVATLLARKTNIPLTQITAEESTKLLNLEQIIHKRIIGQEEAVQLVVTALQRARTELRDQRRPIVNLLFLGPTGVGKTELSKAVAESYFGSEEQMIRLDMSEYQNPDSVARLIGVPGSGQGGILTEAVRKKPFCLLLLDEMEKAHSDILNIFLQVMDDGRLTDALGRTIDFTNVILIATSNAAAHFIQDEVAKRSSVEHIKEVLVREKLRDHFRPEFLNRFDGIVVFKPLDQEEIFKIAGLLLLKVEERLAQKGINLEVTPEAQSELAQAGFDPTFGARPLRRVIQDRVDNALAKYLLKGSIGRRDTVILKKDGVIDVQKAKRLY